MLPVLCANSAEVLQRAMLLIKGAFTKADFESWQKGELVKPNGDLSMKGPPRWHSAPKWNQVVIDHPPVHQIILNDIEAELNTERWLLCPKCGKGQHTAGKALLNGPGDANGVYEFLYCRSCRKQTKSGTWICNCLQRWHQCKMHSMPHLHGLKNKRRTPQEVREAKALKRSETLAMPEPELRKLPTRKRSNHHVQDEGASNIAKAVSESS